MQVFNVHEAKTRFSRPLELIERGEEVVIARSGQPVAKLTAGRPAHRGIAPPGSMKGRDRQMDDDFDAPIGGLFTCLQGPEGESGIPEGGR